jgi:uncharacterized NAD(P)/FAD-binding protein YdhS
MDGIMRSPVRTIAIIGGGFSGTVLATRLLRRPPAEPSRIVLIERRAQVGRGVAYQATVHEQLLNVPAGRMSADPADPLQFARFAQARDPALAAQSFLPRELYGEYLQDLLRQAVQAAPAQVHFECIRAEASALHRIDIDGPYLVSLSGQRQLLADDVVLACGDPPPVAPAWAAAIAGHPAYLGDPHREDALYAGCRTMLLIGTALTMADVAVAAAALNPGIEIHALSRHGLLPAVQSVAVAHGAATQRAVPVDEAVPAHAVPDFLSYLADGPVGARRLLRAARALLRDLRRRGGDWLEVVNAARAAAPELWRRMPAAERGRFLRHVRVHWDVHRHRMPPAIGERLARLRQAGRLQVHAGHVLQLEDAGGALRARWRPRGGSAVREITVDRVINCTGTDRRLTRAQDPLLCGLLASGLAVADPLGLGWLTGAHGALIGHDGSPARHLFYLGPMLRADHWEATAVGELRLHAQRLADALAPITSRSTNCTSPPP